MPPAQNVAYLYAFAFDFMNFFTELQDAINRRGQNKWLADWQVPCHIIGEVATLVPI